ncbi:LysR substrate-binding domain-containing protein [Sphingomonas sp. UYP23]
MDRQLEVRHCRALIAVAEEGGLVRAARRLGWAQSTVSETCLALERVVGSPLLVRRHGLEATLTADGVEFLRHARALVAAADDALASLTPAVGSTLRLGATESISSYLLPPALAAISRPGRAIASQVTVGLCGDLRGMVAAATLDMCFTMEARAPLDAGPATRLIGEVPIVIFRMGDRAGVGELAFEASEGQDLLVPDPTGQLTAHLAEWIGRSGMRLRIRSAGSVEGVKRGVGLGAALGALPAYVMGGPQTGTQVASLDPAYPIRPMLLLATTGARLANSGDGLPLEAAVGRSLDVLLRTTSKTWPI